MAVDTGSTGDLWVEENMGEYGFAEVRRYEGLNPAMLDLTAGRFDGYVSDIPAVLYYIKDKPDLEVMLAFQREKSTALCLPKGVPCGMRWTLSLLR